MYTIIFSHTFKKRYKKILESKPIVRDKIEIFFDCIQNDTPLPQSYKNHALQWKWKWMLECHLLPDILLIYKINNEKLELYMIEIWSHSDLF